MVVRQQVHYRHDDGNAIVISCGMGSPSACVRRWGQEVQVGMQRRAGAPLRALQGCDDDGVVVAFITNEDAGPRGVPASTSWLLALLGLACYRCDIPSSLP